MSGAAARRGRSSSRIGPFHRTASCSSPRRTSHGSPARTEPAGPTRQRPLIRRWLRRTCPPWKLRNSSLPRASTDSSTRPSSRGAICFTAARGCGVSTATFWPTSTCSCSAARRSVSPSGTKSAYDLAMTRRFIGVRWWLGAAFALVAAVSTAIVVAQFTSRSENAFRGHAEQLAEGSAVLAGAEVTRAEQHGQLQRQLPAIAQHFDLDLLVYGADGRLLARAAARSAFARAPTQEQLARRVAG